METGSPFLTRGMRELAPAVWDSPRLRREQNPAAAAGHLAAGDCWDET